MTTLGTAVIVGVGPGLGLALARTFADAGHPVALLARDTTRLDSYVAQLDSSDGRPAPTPPTPRTRRSYVPPFRLRSPTSAPPTS